jgi:iron complex transport system substrate-binding protein
MNAGNPPSRGSSPLMHRSFSRRAVLRGLLGASAALPLASLLAACGGDDASPTAAGSGQVAGTPGAQASPASGGTRSVAHAMGTTDVPANPQRVVVLDMGEMDMALALGVQPVGAALYTATQEFSSHLQEELGDWTRVGTVDEPDLEAIIGLNPDLIISNKLRHEALYENLSRIAPTVFAESLGAEWKASFAVVARALGREAQHAEVMSNYQRRIEAFQAALGERLSATHVSVVRSMPDQIRLYMKASFIGRVIEESGLPRPPVQDKDIFMEEISAERIRDLDADVIFTLYYNRAQGEQLSTLIANPLWDQLAAVQAEQVYEMDDEVWGTGLGPLAAMQVIADLQRVIVDGNVDAAVWGAAETSAVFPVSITHKYGVTEIPAQPQRVLSLGYNEQDAILALGVKPIAVRYWFGEEPHAVFPWAQDELGDATPEVLNMTFGELDIEAIAALQPDFISAVYAGITAEEYALLSRIAPTLAQSSEHIDFGAPWQEMTLMVGQVLGREAQARELVADVESRFAMARSAHPDWVGKQVVVGAPRGDGQFGFVASQDGRARVFTELGFEVPAEFDEIAGEQFWGMLSLERSDLLDQDLIVFHQMPWVEGGRAAIEADPLLSRLNALREGRALFIDGELDSALQFGTVLSLPYLLDSLIPMIEAAMDGDPATVAAP